MYGAMIGSFVHLFSFVLQKNFLCLIHCCASIALYFYDALSLSLFLSLSQIFYHPLLRLNLISEEDHCKIFGNIQIILTLHEGIYYI